jgi:hypothetical protein
MNRVEATRMATVRSLAPADDRWIMCGDNWDLGVEAESYRLAGKYRLIVLITGSDDCADIVALFDEKGKLVDAANVKSDRYTVLMGGEVRPLGRGGALLVVESAPEVTGKTGSDTGLVLIKAGGFAAIADIPRVNSRKCREEVGEGVHVEVAREGGPMARIDVEMRRSVRQFAEDCRTKIGTEAVTIFKGYWSWNAASGAYEPHIDAGRLERKAFLSRLARSIKTVAFGAPPSQT